MKTILTYTLLSLYVLLMIAVLTGAAVRAIAYGLWLRRGRLLWATK